MEADARSLIQQGLDAMRSKLNTSVPSPDVKPIHDSLATNCLRVMDDYLRYNICGLSSPGTHRSAVKADLINACIPQELQYACRHWASHIDGGGCVEDDEGRVFKFLNKHLLYWLEALSLVGSAPESINIIQTIQKLASVS